MADIRVVPDERPSWIKHAGKTTAWILLVSGITIPFAIGAPNAGARLTITVGILALNVGILFAKVQSLVGAWIDAAEVVDESDR